MEDNIFDKVHEVDLKKTMETSYIDYAMSVIAARALPDVSKGNYGQCKICGCWLQFYGSS